MGDSPKLAFMIPYCQDLIKWQYKSKKSVSHTVMSKDDSSEVTVVKAKAGEITADFIISS